MQEVKAQPAPVLKNVNNQGGCFPPAAAPVGAGGGDMKGSWYVQLLCWSPRISPSSPLEHQALFTVFPHSSVSANPWVFTLSPGFPRVWQWLPPHWSSTLFSFYFLGTPRFSPVWFPALSGELPGHSVPTFGGSVAYLYPLYSLITYLSLCNSEHLAALPPSSSDHPH